MRYYIINGEIFTEGELYCVYYYDSECEVDLHRRLTDEEIEKLKKYNTKKEMIEHLKTEGLSFMVTHHNIVTHHDLPVAKCEDNIILNLNDFSIKTAEEIGRREPVILYDSHKIEGHYAVCRLDHDKPLTYEEDNLAGFCLVYKGADMEHFVELYYSDKENELIVLYEHIPKCDLKRVKVDIIDIEKMFKILGDHISKEKITDFCENLIDGGFSKDYFPDYINQMIKEAAEQEEREYQESLKTL